MRLKAAINESVDRTLALHKTEHELQMSVSQRRTMIAPSLIDEIHTCPGSGLRVSSQELQLSRVLCARFLFLPSK